MRAYVLSFAPTKEVAVANGTKAALRMRKGKGLVFADAPAIHTDKLPEGSAQVVAMYSSREAVFEFPNLETLLITSAIAVGKQFTVIDKQLAVTLAKGLEEPSDSLHVAVMVDNDDEVMSIRFAEHNYYPTMTARKLSGRKVR